MIIVCLLHRALVSPSIAIRDMESAVPTRILNEIWGFIPTVNNASTQTQVALIVKAYTESSFVKLLAHYQSVLDRVVFSLLINLPFIS